ncbi:MAG: DUF503 domain-containing protein [Defluviitaleaceae bacterium]|nr:DUF503 domain-containing protein [Defluviitaleaceae bacterium]
MIIGTCKVYLSAEWVGSLKEKRTIVKGIIERVKHKFNVSVAEIEDQDVHRSIVIGYACVTNSTRLADEIVHTVLDFIENNTDAVVRDVVVEIL